MARPREGAPPFQNDSFPGWYKAGYRSAAGVAQTERQRHVIAVRYAVGELNDERLARGDRRRAQADPDGIIKGLGPLGGTLKAGRSWTGAPLDSGDQAEQADTDTGAAPTGRGPFAGRLPAGGVVARLRRRRAGLAGTGPGAQAVAARGAAAGGMTGPGAQARAVRRTERRAGMGAGGVAAQMPGFARVRAIGAALRARRAGLVDRPDVEALADELAEAVEAGDIGAAEIPEAAAESGSAGAELLAALAAAAADAPDDDLADVLAAVAEAAAGAASACTCSTSSTPDDPMMPSAAVLASIASQLQASGLAAPASGRFGRIALAERETAFRLARIAGLAAGATSNQVVNTNKTLAPGSAIYAVAFDPVAGNQLFDLALSNVTISGDNVYQGPLNATDFTSLNSNGEQQPGLLITRSIPTGTQVTFSVTNNTAVPANVLIELRAQATNAVGNIDGSCSA
jgi:hypothetical protein